MKRNRRVGTLALFLFGVVVAGAAVAPAAAADEGPRFVDDIVTVDRGDTASVTVVEPTDENSTTPVRLGSQNDGFAVVALVADGDGDDHVTIDLDTAAAGDGNASGYLSVSDGDELGTVDQTTPALDEPISAGEYELSVGEERDVGTLAVFESDSGSGTPVEGEGNVTLEAAPEQTVRGTTDLDPGTEVTVNIKSADPTAPFLAREWIATGENGSYEASFDLQYVEPGTEFNVTVQRDGRTVTSLAGQVEECTDDCGPATDWPGFDDGLVTTDRGSTAEIPIVVPGETGDTARVVVGNESSDGFEARATVRDADGDGTVTLYVDTGNAGNGDAGGYLSVSDADELVDASQVGEGDVAPMEPDSYDVTIGPLDAPYDVGTFLVRDPDAAEADGSGGPQLDTAEPRASIVTAGDELRVASAEDQRIYGETTLEPGTTLSLQIQSTDPSTPFIARPRATVTEYGTFNTTVDTSNVGPETRLEIAIRNGSATVGGTEGRVVDCDGDCRQVGAFSGDTDQNLPTDSVNVASVVESDRDGSARIPVTFGDADALTVVIGDEDGGYELAATVRDTTGDDRATLVFRPGEAAADAATLLVSEDGESRPANVTAETARAERLDAGEYPVTVRNGTASTDGHDDVGVVVVRSGTETDASSGANVVVPDGTDIPIAGVGAIGLGGVLSVLGIGRFLGTFGR